MTYVFVLIRCAVSVRARASFISREEQVYAEQAEPVLKRGHESYYTYAHAHVDWRNDLAEDASDNRCTYKSADQAYCYFYTSFQFDHLA